jgi:hypothetical protein
MRNGSNSCARNGTLLATALFIRSLLQRTAKSLVIKLLISKISIVQSCEELVSFMMQEIHSKFEASMILQMVQTDTCSFRP